MERESIDFLPPEGEKPREDTRPIDRIADYLSAQMSRARLRVGYRLEPVEELVGMVDTFRDNPKVLEPLATLADAHGDRRMIFNALSLAESAMSRDPHLTAHPKLNASDLARKRVNGLLGQWPVLDNRDVRIKPEDYKSWWAGRDDNHESQAA